MGVNLKIALLVMKRHFVIGIWNKQIKFLVGNKNFQIETQYRWKKPQIQLLIALHCDRNETNKTPTDQNRISLNKILQPEQKQRPLIFESKAVKGFSARARRPGLNFKACCKKRLLTGTPHEVASSFQSPKMLKMSFRWSI